MTVAELRGPEPRDKSYDRSDRETGAWSESSREDGGRDQRGAATGQPPPDSWQPPERGARQGMGSRRGPLCQHLDSDSGLQNGDAIHFCCFKSPSCVLCYSSTGHRYRWGPRKACVKGMSGPRVRLCTEGSRPSVCGVQVRTRGHCSPGKADTLHSVLGWCAGQWSSRAPRSLPHPPPPLETVLSYLPALGALQ